MTKITKKKCVLFRIFLAYVFIFPICFSSCEKTAETEEPETTDYTETNELIQALMYYMYYWNEKIEGKIISGRNVISVPSSTPPDEYFYSLLYDKSMVNTSLTSEYDRWSFICPYDEYTGVMVEGEYKSYGYFISQVPPPDYSLRVCFVYENSPMAKAGIERGYELKKMNGTDVMTLINNGSIYDELNKESNRFVFADRSGRDMEEKTISAATFRINPIVKKEVYQLEGKKIGYMVYNSFITASKENMTTALNDFKNEKIDELVLDLRYNGGGDVDVANALCEYLLPASAGVGETEFSRYVFSKRTNQFAGENDRDDLKDHVYKIKRHNDALDISRLFVIVSDMTASASEEVINSLEPFYNGEVILVGTNTEGKPVGMYVWVDDSDDPQWAIAPITFRIDNRNGEGSYFDGLVPDFHVNDDLYSEFGIDVERMEGENSLVAVFRYIMTGKFPSAISAQSTGKTPPRLIRLKGLQIHAGCM